MKQTLVVLCWSWLPVGSRCTSQPTQSSASDLCAGAGADDCKDAWFSARCSVGCTRIAEISSFSRAPSSNDELNYLAPDARARIQWFLPVDLSIVMLPNLHICFRVDLEDNTRQPWPALQYNVGISSTIVHTAYSFDSLVNETITIPPDLAQKISPGEHMLELTLCCERSNTAAASMGIPAALQGTPAVLQVTVLAAGVLAHNWNRVRLCLIRMVLLQRARVMRIVISSR